MSIETINSFLQQFDETNYPKTLSLPAIMYLHIENDIRFNRDLEPKPPKICTGVTVTDGFFGKTYTETYKYDYNDPKYIKEMELYKSKRFKENDFKMTILGRYGDIVLERGDIKQTEIIVID